MGWLKEYLKKLDYKEVKKFTYLFLKIFHDGDKKKEKDDKNNSEISKNIIFPAKLSYQEQYPTVSSYKTPKYIEQLREKKALICKNCGHRLYKLDNGKVEHFTRYYHSHSMPYHSKKCYAKVNRKNVFGQPFYCGCCNPKLKKEGKEDRYSSNL